VSERGVGEVRPSVVERAFYAFAFRAESDPFARRILIRLVNAFFKAVVFERKRGGHRLLDFARKGAIRFGRWRAPVLRVELGLDTESLADMSRLQDWEDRVFGVTGHWTQQEASRATKCETHCPFAEVAKGEPAICSDVIHALETATFRELNPRYRLLPLERLLSKGHACCEFRHELLSGTSSSS
jgi:hypothetical protein